MQVVSCSSGLKELTLIPLMERIHQLIQFGVTHNIIPRNIESLQSKNTHHHLNTFELQRCSLSQLQLASHQQLVIMMLFGSLLV